VIYNIDVINKIVATKLGLNEQTVKKVTNFYWAKVNTHITTFNEQPINLMHIGHVRTSKILIRNKLLILIKKLRKFKKYNRNELTKRALNITIGHETLFRKLWALRNNTEYILKDE
jgi:hypothetical protein